MDRFPRLDNEFATSRALARTNTPGRLIKGNGSFRVNKLYGFWNPPGQTRHNRPRRCEVEMILKEAEEALADGKIEVARRLIGMVRE